MGRVIRKGFGQVIEDTGNVVTTYAGAIDPKGPGRPQRGGVEDRAAHK